MFLSWSVRIKDTVDSVGLIPRLPFTRCPTFKSIKGHEMSRSKGITATYTDMRYLNLNARFRFRQVDLMWFAWFAGLSSWFWVMNLLNAVQRNHIDIEFVNRYRWWLSTSELLLLDVSSLEREPEDVDTDPIAHVIYHNVQRCYQTTTMFEMDSQLVIRISIR